MTKPCIVPKCKTGNRRVKTKCSVFRVPKDVNLRQKWVEAIPGRTEFGDTFYVCEKHFRPEFIRKKIVKKNEKGDIIFERNYQRSYLEPNAIPTEFSDSGSNFQQVFEKTLESGNIAPVLEVDTSNNAYEESVEEMSGEVLEKSQEVGPEKAECDFPWFKILNVSTLHEDLEKSQEVHPEKAECDLQRCRILQASTLHEGLEKSQEVGPEKAECDSQRCRILQVSTLKVGTTEECISVPWSWSASEMLINNKHHTVFTHITSVRDRNDVSVPILQKAVTINDFGLIRYSIYNTNISIEKNDDLPTTLTSLGEIPRILMTFEKKHVCQGSKLDIDSVPKTAFHSPDNQWHSEECPLLTKSRKSLECKKMLQQINRKQRRLMQKKNIERISKFQNPEFERKRKLFQKKINIEREKELCAQKKGKPLRNDDEDDEDDDDDMYDNEH